MTDCKTFWDLWWDACYWGTPASERALTLLPEHIKTCLDCQGLHDGCTCKRFREEDCPVHGKEDTGYEI